MSQAKKKIYPLPAQEEIAPRLEAVLDSEFVYAFPYIEHYAGLQLDVHMIVYHCSMVIEETYPQHSVSLGRMYKALVQAVDALIDDPQGKKEAKKILERPPYVRRSQVNEYARDLGE